MWLKGDRPYRAQGLTSGKYSGHVGPWPERGIGDLLSQVGKLSPGKSSDFPQDPERLHSPPALLPGWQWLCSCSSCVAWLVPGALQLFAAIDAEAFISLPLNSLLF